jgi:hypothetical protein
MRYFRETAEVMSKTESTSPLEDSAGQKEPVVRDGFSMPKDDYDLIEVIRDKCWELKLRPNKSEVLRAGLIALNGMSQKQLRDAMAKVGKLKPGRTTKRS